MTSFSTQFPLLVFPRRARRNQKFFPIKEARSKSILEQAVEASREARIEELWHQVLSDPQLLEQYLLLPSQGGAPPPAKGQGDEPTLSEAIQNLPPELREMI